MRRGNNVCCLCEVSRGTHRSHFFHRFPSDSARCQVWVNSCNQKELLGIPASELYEKYRLCSAHFELSQYLNISCHLLKKNAIPTIGMPKRPEESLPGCSPYNKDNTAKVVALSQTQHQPGVISCSLDDGVSCDVPGCDRSIQSWRDNNQRGSKPRLFSPQDAGTQKTWQQQINQFSTDNDSEKLAEKLSVCDIHFTCQSFISLDTLKSDVMPTLYLDKHKNLNAKAKCGDSTYWWLNISYPNNISNNSLLNNNLSANELNVNNNTTCTTAAEILTEIKVESSDNVSDEICDGASKITSTISRNCHSSDTNSVDPKITSENNINLNVKSSPVLKINPKVPKTASKKHINVNSSLLIPKTNPQVLKTASENHINVNSKRSPTPKINPKTVSENNNNSSGAISSSAPKIQHLAPIFDITVAKEISSANNYNEDSRNMLCPKSPGNHDNSDLNEVHSSITPVCNLVVCVDDIGDLFSILESPMNDNQASNNDSSQNIENLDLKLEEVSDNSSCSLYDIPPPVKKLKTISPAEKKKKRFLRILNSCPLKLPSSKWAVHCDPNENTVLICEMSYKHGQVCVDKSICLALDMDSPDIKVHGREVKLKNCLKLEEVGDVEDLVAKIDALRVS